MSARDDKRKINQAKRWMKMAQEAKADGKIESHARAMLSICSKDDMYSNIVIDRIVEDVYGEA